MRRGREGWLSCHSSFGEFTNNSVLCPPGRVSIYIVCVYLFALVFMCLSVHRCLCECHCVFCYSGHVPMDVYVCVILQISMCAVRIFLWIFACLCVQEFVSLVGLCVFLWFVWMCVLCVCVLSADVHVWCACLCLCVSVYLGPFWVRFALCVCLSECVSPPLLSRFQGAGWLPAAWSTSGRLTGRQQGFHTPPLLLGCANHWVICRWQMCGCQAWRRDCGGGMQMSRHQGGVRRQFKGRKGENKPPWLQC